MKNFKSFEAIERILSTRHEWGLLEENYQAMFRRAKGLSLKVRLVLWRNLAELYRQVLRSPDHAIMAYEVLGKLDQKMTAAFIAVSDLAHKKKLFMRDAAYVISISRVAQACKDRGWV